jgi:hypothetical protein
VFDPYTGEYYEPGKTPTEEERRAKMQRRAAAAEAKPAYNPFE